MGTKMAVAFCNIFMNKVETDILSQSFLNRSFGNVTQTTSHSGLQTETE